MRKLSDCPTNSRKSSRRWIRSEAAYAKLRLLFLLLVRRRLPRGQRPGLRRPYRQLRQRKTISGSLFCYDSFLVFEIIASAAELPACISATSHSRMFCEAVAAFADVGGLG